MLRNVSREALGKRTSRRSSEKRMWKRMVSPVRDWALASSNDSLFYSGPTAPVMFHNRHEAVTECTQQKRKDIHSNRSEQIDRTARKEEESELGFSA